jgi:hypothetical protein
MVELFCNTKLSVFEFSYIFLLLLSEIRISIPVKLFEIPSDAT